MLSFIAVVIPLSKKKVKFRFQSQKTKFALRNPGKKSRLKGERINIKEYQGANPRSN